MLKKTCIEGKCAFWIQVIGSHPQTGARLAEHDCTFAWLPYLLIENSQVQRQSGAAMESFRNEVHHGNQAFHALLGFKESAQLPGEASMQGRLFDGSEKNNG